MYDEDEEELEHNPVPPPPTSERSWGNYVLRTFPVGTPVVFQPQIIGPPDGHYDLLGFATAFAIDPTVLYGHVILHQHGAYVPTKWEEDMTYLRVYPGVRGEVVQQINDDGQVGIVVSLYPPYLGTSPVELVELFDEWEAIGFGEEVEDEHGYVQVEVDVRVEVSADDIMRAGLDPVIGHPGTSRAQLVRKVKDLLIMPMVDTWGAAASPIAQYRPNPRPGIAGLTGAAENPKILALGPFAAAAAANPYTTRRAPGRAQPSVRTYEVSSYEPFGAAVTIDVPDFDEDEEASLDFLAEEIRQTFSTGLDDQDLSRVGELDVGGSYDVCSLGVTRKR